LVAPAAASVKATGAEFEFDWEEEDRKVQEASKAPTVVTDVPASVPLVEQESAAVVSESVVDDVPAYTVEAFCDGVHRNRLMLEDSLLTEQPLSGPCSSVENRHDDDSEQAPLGS
jgi:hypothetical protein